MNFENVLREMNKDRMGLTASEVRNSGKYLFSFFGEPHAEQTWGWRMVGHHVSLNYTIVGGFCLAHTPMLFGAEPAEFGIFKPMKDDEDRGFDLLSSLDADQRARTIFTSRAARLRHARRRQARRRRAARRPRARIRQLRNLGAGPREAEVDPYRRQRPRRVRNGRDRSSRSSAAWSRAT